MKTSCAILALCVVLSCASFSHAGGLHRRLLNQPPATATATASSSCVVFNGFCYASAKVSTTAINDAAASIAAAYSSAIASVEGGGDVTAEADSFAFAVAEAYALIISNHVLSVDIIGTGYACAYTHSQGVAYAEAIAKATAQAFASSDNEYASAFAACMATAVAVANVQVTQHAFVGTCVNDYGYDYIFARIISVGYAKAIAAASAYAFTQIQNNVPIAAASCESAALAITNSG